MNNMDNPYIFVTPRERKERKIAIPVLYALLTLIAFGMCYISDFNGVVWVVTILYIFMASLLLHAASKYFPYEFGTYSYSFNTISNLFGDEQRTIRYDDLFYISVYTMLMPTGAKGETYPKEFVVLWKADMSPPENELGYAIAAKKYQIIVLPLIKEIPEILHKSLGVDSIPRYPDKKLYCNAQKYDVLYDENGEFRFRELDGG